MSCGCGGCSQQTECTCSPMVNCQETKRLKEQCRESGGSCTMWEEEVGRDCMDCDKANMCKVNFTCHYENAPSWGRLVRGRCMKRRPN